MIETQALPIISHWHCPTAVAVNHIEIFARDTLLAFEQRPCSSNTSICKLKPHHSLANVLLRRAQQLGLDVEDFVGGVDHHCRCSEDLDQLQHGRLQYWRERTPRDLLADPFPIDVVEEDFVLWQLGKIQKMHQLVRNHRMETGFTIVGHGES
jgi:hypothetical protein